MVFEILIAILAVCGVLLILWTVTGLLLKPAGGRSLRMLLAVQGDAQELEHAVRGVAWLRETGLCVAGLTVIDCGLSDVGLRCLRAICGRYEFVEYLPEAKLSEILGSAEPGGERE